MSHGTVRHGPRQPDDNSSRASVPIWGAVHPIRWKRQFGDLGTAEVRELRQLREENRKLKQLVADRALDKTTGDGRGS